MNPGDMPVPFRPKVDKERLQSSDERDRLTAQLAAAHGLQARAERAEAALRTFMAAVANIDQAECLTTNDVEALTAARDQGRAALAVPS